MSFQTGDYARHFRSSCLRILGADSQPDSLDVGGRRVGIGVDPIGIDVDGFREVLRDPETERLYDQLVEQYSGRRLVLGVERLDYTKGIPQKLQAFERYLELYCAVVRKRGGDPDIGPRLPLLLEAAGFQDVGVLVVQPCGTRGDVKLMNPLTMENIADAVLADGLATREEIERNVADMYAFAADPKTITGVPRIVQAWGRRPHP